MREGARGCRSGRGCGSAWGRRSVRAIGILTAIGIADPVPRPGAAATEGHAWTIDWEGTLRGEAAFRIDPPRSLSKERNLVGLRARARGPGSIAATVGVRGFYDAAYDLSDRHPREVERSLESEGALREAFLEWSPGAWSFRAGKQQVVWGEAFGRFLTDVVVPKDLREFLLPEFEFIRIPLWMGETTWTHGDAAVQAVVVPDLRYSTVAPAGGDFAFGGEATAAPAAPAAVEPVRRPPRTWRNAEYGLRVSWLRSGWDLSALFFRGFDDLPVPFRRLEPVPGGGTEIVLAPGPARLSTFGGTASKSRGRAIYRGEMACDRGRLFPAADPADRDGVVGAGLLGAIAGVDVALPRRSMLGVQVLHQEILGSSAGLLGPPGASALMLRATAWEARGRWSGRLEAHFGRRGDSMVRPRAGYRFPSGMQATAGLDLFAGPEDTFYGRFGRSDRFFVEISYPFPPSSPGTTGGEASAERRWMPGWGGVDEGHP